MHPMTIRCLFFFFNDTATTEIYTLSLHDALPISRIGRLASPPHARHSIPVSSVPTPTRPAGRVGVGTLEDRKSTRLNSSHSQISYAVFCLKKKKKIQSILCGLYPHQHHTSPIYRA